MVWLRFSFEPTNKVLRIWLGCAVTRRIKFNPALADRTELAVKTANSRAPIEWLCFRGENYSRALRKAQTDDSCIMRPSMLASASDDRP